jgi:hypothetical protein
VQEREVRIELVGTERFIPVAIACPIILFYEAGQAATGNINLLKNVYETCVHFIISLSSCIE